MKAAVVWDGSQWVQIMGPAGPTGATGATGPTGPTGATGPAAPAANLYLYANFT